MCGNGQDVVGIIMCAPIARFDLRFCMAVEHVPHIVWLVNVDDACSLQSALRSTCPRGFHTPNGCASGARFANAGNTSIHQSVVWSTHPRSLRTPPAVQAASTAEVDGTVLPLTHERALYH